MTILHPKFIRIKALSQVVFKWRNMNIKGSIQNAYPTKYYKIKGGTDKCLMVLLLLFLQSRLRREFDFRKPLDFDIIKQTISFFAVTKKLPFTVFNCFTLDFLFDHQSNPFKIFVMPG